MPEGPFTLPVTQILTHMTKNEEIALLTEFAARLGTDSYYGPVLADQLPEIIRDIRSDIVPSADVARAKRDAAAWREEALASATDIRASAHREAEAIVAYARKVAAAATLEAAKRDLRRSLESIS